MAAKKTGKEPAPRATAQEAALDLPGALQMIAETLGNHDTAIRQLAEVVVNLHQNIRALRDVIEPLAERSTDERVIQARSRLRRLKLDE